MSRRAFAESACGMAAALLVMNQVYGCSSSKGERPSGAAGSGPVPSPTDFYDVDPTMMQDVDMACESLEGNEFILDVQVHPASPFTPWRDAPLPTTAQDFIQTLFVDSDTIVACLSGVPGARDLNIDNVRANDDLQELVEKLGKSRLMFHANLDPRRGSSELDYMEQVTEMHDLAAWKVYPHVGPWRLDDQEHGLPFLERSRQLGVRIIAAHRGIAGDAGLYSQASSPVDLTRAAAQYPDIAFLTYHAAWESGVDEAHPFDPNDANPKGIDRLIRGVLDSGITKEGNVYAELGSTWRNLMTSPLEAAHALGKLLLYLGEDRIIWGTDSVFTGSPQEQIVAFRSFQIPEQLQQMHGYPALTPAIKAKIFGLNGARVYGVDPTEVRCAIKSDFVNRLQLSRREDPASLPLIREKNFGPQNRREFLDFLRCHPV